MKVNAFGRSLELHRKDGRWQVFDLGNEGKKRPARDICLPDELTESEVISFLADLLHEFASPRHPVVQREPS